ncbi:MAG: hypothetical protein HOG12_09375 [Alphaproteobacteria bacterium]|nr:hypothetical protein [Alphaproteobacteria bacterium]
MTDRAVLVFTKKNLADFESAGGSRAWKLNRKTMADIGFAVFCRNAKREDTSHAGSHRQGFLVAKVAGVVPAPLNENRFMILFDEVADIEMDELWMKDRNPIRYVNLSEIGINPDHLEFRPFEGNSQSDTKKSLPDGITISEAKRGLAISFGVDESSIEIVIRG